MDIQERKRNYWWYVFGVFLFFISCWAAKSGYENEIAKKQLINETLRLQLKKDVCKPEIIHIEKKVYIPKYINKIKTVFKNERKKDTVVVAVNPSATKDSLSRKRSNPFAELLKDLDDNRK